MNSYVRWVLAAFENLGIKRNKTYCELLECINSGENTQEEMRVQITLHVAYPFES